MAQRSLLRELATTRRPTAPVIHRYDADRQISFVLERDRWVPSWESEALHETKKCDIETGEDQKGQ